MMKIKLRNWKSLLVALLFLGGSAVPLIAVADPFEPFGVARPRTIKPAPDFVLQDIHGKPVNLKQFKGKPILLNFWATWCGPCKEELPSMQRLHEASKSNGAIQIIAISIDRFNIDKVSQYARDLHLSFPILLDPDRETRSAYFVRSLPTSYLIDADGKLQGFISGARKWDSPTARQVFQSLARPKK